MQRSSIFLLVLAIALATQQTVFAMRKSTPEASRAILTGQRSSLLGKQKPTPAMSAQQQAALGRRVSSLGNVLERIRVTGSAQASFPPAAVDGILDWQAANAKDVELWWDADTQTPFFIKGTDLSLPEAVHLPKSGLSGSASAALGTLQRLSGLLGLKSPSDELRVISEDTDELGMTHIRFQQTYRGVDVWAQGLAVHFDHAGRLSSIQGRWIQTPLSLGTATAAVSAQEARDFILAWYQSGAEIQSDSVWITIYIDSSEVPHLAWAARVLIGDAEAYEVLVDAVSPRHLHESPLVCTDGPVVGSGVELSGTTRTVYAYQEGTTYYMLNTTKPMPGFIAIYNYGTTSHTLVQTSSVTSWGNPAAVSASHNLGIVYDYFFDVHGRNSIDGSGGTIRAIVNDFGTANNASFNHGSQTMKFGLGDGATFSNLAAALDVTGHEMAHGVINATAGLKYEFQSGALNESFADVFGVMTEFYHLGASGDWLLGEDVTTPGVAGDGLRDMENPASAKVCCGQAQPSHMSQYEVLPYSAEGDWGGVHRNSGIPNRAFYLTATSIGRDRADSIWFRALSFHLGPLSQFTDLRLATLQAASELYPGNETISSALVSAFNTVGITDGSGAEPPADLPAPTSTQWIAAKDEITGRAALFDTAGTFLRYISSSQVMSKPSTSDSGDVIYFVDHTWNVTAVDKWGTWEVQLGDPAVDFNSVSVSPGGSKLAYFVQWDPVLYVYDLDIGEQEHAWLLYSPTYTAGGELFDVLYPDVLEWTIEGARIVFDCQCVLPIQGDTLFYWDIRTIDVATGLIDRTLPGVAPGTQIGNPTLGKVHTDLLGFDFIRFDDTVFVNTANLSENTFAAISKNGTSLGRPSFSPSDTRIVLQYDGGGGSNLWKISYDPGQNQPIGSFQAVTSSASFANWRFEGRDTPSGVFDDVENGAISVDFTIEQNVPNPFNAGTTIIYASSSTSAARFDVFNILGQHVYREDLGEVGPGPHSVTWLARDDAGNEMSSGVYFYRLTIGKSSQTRKMVFLK